jgi:hypothetical protein
MDISAHATLILGQASISFQDFWGTRARSRAPVPSSPTASGAKISCGLRRDNTAWHYVEDRSPAWRLARQRHVGRQNADANFVPRSGADSGSSINRTFGWASKARPMPTR